MIEIRFHGRGGQGSVVASKILADAVASEGKYVQAFPEFGVERRGQPVTAFIRIDDRPVQFHCKIYEPDHIVVLDPTLIEVVNVTEGLKHGGWVIINTIKSPDEMKEIFKNFRIATVDATSIAINHGLGSKSAPIVNTAILGAFARVFPDIVKLESIEQAIKKGAPVKPEENAASARDAYNSVKFAT
mgnify:CR=1 FL=1